MPPEALKDAALVAPQLSFSDQLKNTIAPHSSIEGWAAFDCVHNLEMPNRRRYEIDFKDNIGMIYPIRFPTPLPIEGESDITIGSITLTGIKADLSGAYIKFYHDRQ